MDKSMNGFIVWDKEEGMFIPDGYYGVLGNGKLLTDKGFKDQEHEYIEDSIEHTVHNYIGKTDIEGNKIYADSSIVEFQVLDQILPDRFKSIKGYFFFNSECLKYEIFDIKTKEAIYLWGGFVEKNLRVIDTLQENKLGLFGGQNEN